MQVLHITAESAHTTRLIELSASAQMSDPTDSDVQLPASPENQVLNDDLLIKNFQISKKMRPFANRMQLRLKNLDWTNPATANQFESSRDEMKKILAKKKIPEAKANWATTQTLEAAADHQLDMLRRDMMHKRSRDVTKLVALLERLASAVSKLSPQWMQSHPIERLARGSIAVHLAFMMDLRWSVGSDKRDYRRQPLGQRGH